ncbi:MAG: tetratricopeptide repeat protein, partial [Armatimonadota bacterium]
KLFDEIRALYAQTPLAKGQWAEAARLLNRATELDPCNASYQVRLAEALAQMGDGTGAAWAWSRAGESLVAKERWAEALTHFQAALERDPDNQSAKNGLPAAYRGLGMEAKARAAEAQLVLEALHEMIVGPPGTLVADLLHESRKLTGLSAPVDVAGSTLGARMAASLLAEPMME